MATKNSKPKSKSAGKTKAGGANSVSKSKQTDKPLSASAKPSCWTFLTNHTHVLILLHRSPDTVLREVAQQVGITERAVQRIVHELEEGGFIQRERVGRRNHYEVVVDQPLRHPIESHHKIGELLDLVGA